jgi:hypothetical protein
MGSTQRFDAIVKYVVVDDLDEIITRKQETLAIETTVSVNRNIKLPETIKPGKYYLQVIADYNNKQAESASEFEVVEKAIEKKPSIYVPPTPIKEPTTNVKQNTSKNPTITIPSTTNNGKTLGEVLTEARETALDNPQSAANDCARLSSSEQKDICYSTVADSSQESSYCDKISGTTYRDNCYLAFVIKLNLDSCDKITATSDKAFCEQLNLVRLMNKYYEENNTEKILELKEKFNPSVIQNNNPQVQTYEYAYNEPVTIMDIINDGTLVEELPDVVIPDETQTDNLTIEENITVEENVTA